MHKYNLSLSLTERPTQARACRCYVTHTSRCYVRAKERAKIGHTARPHVTTHTHFVWGLKGGQKSDAPTQKSPTCTHSQTQACARVYMQMLYMWGLKARQKSDTYNVYTQTHTHTNVYVRVRRSGKHQVRTLCDGWKEGNNSCMRRCRTTEKMREISTTLQTVGLNLANATLIPPPLEKSVWPNLS